MNSFKKFSKKVDTLSKKHAGHRLYRALAHIEYYFLRAQNRSLPFRSLKENDVAESIVDGVVEVYHPRQLGAMEHAVGVELTGKVLLEGCHINAFKVVKWEPLDNAYVKTTVQPCWI